MPFVSRVQVEEHPHRGQLFLMAQEGTRKLSQPSRAHRELLSGHDRLYICSRPVAEASHMAKLQASGGRNCITHSKSWPGWGGKDELGSTHPFNIVWIMQVGWSCSHVTRWPGSSPTISEIKVGVLERREMLCVWHILLKCQERTPTFRHTLGKNSHWS